MALFEESTVLAEHRARRYGESIYAYYRDSERPGILAIRNLLEAWFHELPQGERIDLQQRFRSPIERQHRSAVFELFLHHFLLRCGFDVQFHPDVPNVTTHPDFLVSRNGEALLYLEAIAVSNSTTEEAENNRMNQVYDVLNNLESPDFYLALHVEGAPDSPPAGARLRRALGRWLATLDREAIQRAYIEGRSEDIPRFPWAHDGWNIIFEPMPKGEKSRANTSVRPIGMTMPMQARRLTLDDSLRDAVVAKDRYGRLALPLVVAAQVIDNSSITKADVISGLFGHEAFDEDAEGRTRFVRVPNGAWISPTGPVHRSVSAVIAWSTLEPWNFSAIEPIVVHNPYATVPLPRDVLPIGQHFVDRERRALVRQEGLSMEALLGLPRHWVSDD